ncbi:MAG: chemotaxis response regulator protein-glutamate methylesterase [Ignavibacteriaceae bacterium]|nr:chemotaxis response regulator protein-glutamate methylesterase [Ignavibacteriaceae bacterium]
MTRKIKALIVDDSAFMRKSLTLMLESSGEIEVIGCAKDGLEGIQMVKEKVPDIITMDIEMPKMDGLTALQKIMSDFPTPVLMVSSLTTQGAEETIKALEYGAVDFIPKELSYVNVNIVKIREELINKVKEIVRQKSLSIRLKRIKNIQLRRTTKPSQPAKSLLGNTSLPQFDCRAVAIGISTGGPLSLQKLVPKLHSSISAPIFIVQHMPPKFTKSLADRLNGMSDIEVKEAENFEEIRPGVVYMAPGGFHMTANKNSKNKYEIIVSEYPNDTLHRPSVDIMLDSITNVFGAKHTLAVIMTGMGKDGSEAVKKLKQQGGYTIAQDEETSVVYGMPKAVVDNGTADLILPLDNIANQINKVFNE